MWYDLTLGPCSRSDDVNKPKNGIILESLCPENCIILMQVIGKMLAN